MQRIVKNPAILPTRLTKGLVKAYENEDHSIGLHAGDKRVMMVCLPIVALSLGATGRFMKDLKKRFESRRRCGANGVIGVDGDLMVMGGAMQRTHKIMRFLRWRDVM